MRPIHKEVSESPLASHRTFYLSFFLSWPLVGLGAGNPHHLKQWSWLCAPGFRYGVCTSFFPGSRRWGERPSPQFGELKFVLWFVVFSKGFGCECCRCVCSLVHLPGWGSGWVSVLVIWVAWTRPIFPKQAGAGSMSEAPLKEIKPNH